jgi:hypothetical protein
LTANTGDQRRATMTEATIGPAAAQPANVVDSATSRKTA